MIGAEGTLGIITAAVLKLSPKPEAEATAMLATPSLDEALHVLNRLQSAQMDPSRHLNICQVIISMRFVHVSPRKMHHLEAR